MQKYKRQIVIGDVHGCFNELMKLLEKLKFNPQEDRFICAGDLVDRGPDSAKVVQWFRENNEKYPENVQCIMGNHDLKHCRYYENQLEIERNPKRRNIVNELSPEKKAIYKSFSKEDLQWIGELPYYLNDNELGKWVVVHAGMQPSRTLWEQSSDRLCHIRFVDKRSLKLVKLNQDFTNPEGSLFWADLYEDQWNIVYGHTVHSLEDPEIQRAHNGSWLIGIDTGCCFSGRLTAFIIPEDPNKIITKEDFVQVSAENTGFNRNYIKSSWKKKKK